MADDADKAGEYAEYAEQELRARIAACRGADPEPMDRDECIDCGDPLDPHRRMYGVCVPCKIVREARDRRLGVGA